MSYKNDEDEKTYQSEKEKYYLKLEKSIEQKNEEPDIPSFDEIFRDLPKGGGINSLADHHNDTIFFTSLDTHLYAVNTRTGKMQWRFKTGDISISSPLVHRKHVYFGSNDGNFYCVDLDGKLVWKKHTGDIIVGSPIAIGNKIFIGNGSGYFFCFSENGDELWKFKTGGGLITIPSAINNKIFIGSYDKCIYAIDLDGHQVWKFRAGERIGSSLVMDNGNPVFTYAKRSYEKCPTAKNPTIHGGSYDNHAYALDEKGNLKWKTNCESSVTGSMSGEKNTVYASTLSGYIYSLNAEDGKINWKFKSDGPIFYSGISKAGRLYFLCYDKKLYCVSNKGEILWEFLTSGSMASLVKIVSNKIYFGSTNSIFYCLDLEKRTVDWTFQVGMGGTEEWDEKIENLRNTMVEWDKKIFKIWKPETTKKSTIVPIQNSPGYAAPRGFSFGGESTYESSRAYQPKLLEKTKKTTYR
ncbi:MAG: PQQ-binding-like beta-propeller repeat protein [Candidatus Aenigmatarchaeota archaeon]